MRPRTLIALATAALAVAAPAAIAQGTPAPVLSQQARNATSYLFVFDTEAAQMAPIAGRKDAYTFIMPLRSVRHAVTWFTDRPDRDAGTLPMKAFVRLWSRPGADSFGQDPPNVALDFTLGGTERTFIATMSAPRIVPSGSGDGTGSLQATMTAVPQRDVGGLAVGTGKLATHAARAHRARSANAARRWFLAPTGLTNASVVVDNFNAPDTNDCSSFPGGMYWVAFTSAGDYAAAFDGCLTQLVPGGGSVVDGAIANLPAKGMSFPSTETLFNVTCPTDAGMQPPAWTPGHAAPSGWGAFVYGCTNWKANNIVLPSTGRSCPLRATLWQCLRSEAARRG